MKGKRLEGFIAFGLTIILGCLLGMLGFSAWDKVPPAPIQPVAWSPDAQWIAPQESSYRLYARHAFYIPDQVEAGWMRLSADNDFILYVNGQRIETEISVIRNSLGIASQLSEPLQRFNDSTPYRYRSNEWLHLSNENDWKVTAYVDLTTYLQPGKNVIAIEVQKSRRSPRLAVEGLVYPTQGSDGIDLTTGKALWRVSTLSETRQKVFWYGLNFPDEAWAQATAIGSIRETTYSRLSEKLYSRSLQGTWITGNANPQGGVWLAKDWQILKQNHSRAFVRFSGDGSYGLLINGNLVKSFGIDDRNLLHLYDVTNFARSGLNTLAVHLIRPLDPDWSANRPSSAAKANTLGFFLDAWVETSQRDVVSEISTDSSWSSLVQPIAARQNHDQVESTPAVSLNQPDPQEFERQFGGDAYLLNYPDFLMRQGCWQLSGIGVTFILALALGRFWLGGKSWWDSFKIGSGLLLPGLLYLIGIGLLKHRYAEAEAGFFFALQNGNLLILLGFLGVIAFSLLWTQVRRGSREISGLGLEKFPQWWLLFSIGFVVFAIWGLAAAQVAISSRSMNISIACIGICGIFCYPIFRDPLHHFSEHIGKAVRPIWTTWGQWVLLAVIVGVGLGLRVYDLNFVGLDNDEWTSYDAIRGILRTGAPEATSEIWYTRSPFYHYLTALWLLVLGDSSFNGRLLSVLFGTATLILTFVFTREVTGKTWVALLVTAILAIDPSVIRFSRLLRFYQIYQFTSLLALWAFMKGFIDKSGRWYQYLFFIAITLTVLSQEVFVTALPCFLIGFLVFYRPFRLSTDWRIVASCVVSLAVIGYDLVFFAIRCLTPVVALSNSLDSAMKPQLVNVTGAFITFFAGPARIYTLYSVGFFIGLIYFLMRRNGRLLFLYSTVLLHLIFLTILVTQRSNRYAYAVYIPFIVLAVYGAICVISDIGERLEISLNNLLPLKSIALAFVLILLAFNIEPARVLAGYQDAITRRNTEVYEYIRDHRKPGDAVISVTPAHAPSIGGLDYYLTGSTISFDIPYWHDGRVIDRWGGGVIVSNLDQLNRILQKSNRVWLHLDENRDVKFDPKMLNFVQTFTKPEFETFGARLRLWRREDGYFPTIPNQGKDLGVY
jgi:Dolichyl-phosphate-mannose-protein mannosyltransferase